MMAFVMNKGHAIAAKKLFAFLLRVVAKERSATRCCHRELSHHECFGVVGTAGTQLTSALAPPGSVCAENLLPMNSELIFGALTQMLLSLAAAPDFRA